MNKYLILSVFLIAPIYSNAQVCQQETRYVNPVFSEDEILVSEVEFAVFDSTDLWLSGDSSNCFNTSNYLQPISEGRFAMAMDVYEPDPSIDNCSDRLAILFMHGGGYAHVAGNKQGGNPVLIAMEAARRGYVVFVMDYRKGWDIKNAQARNSNPNFPIPLLPGCQNCPCDGPDCDDFSFVLATYKMAQDAIAAHKRIVSGRDEFGINHEQVNYWGASTGAIGVAHAAYGGAAFEASENSSGTSLLEIAGPLDAFGDSPVFGWPQKPASVHLLAGSLKDLSYIDAQDDIPIFFSHGSRDEAVPYCQGRVLSMRYAGVNDLFENLGLYGPGTLYQRFVELNDPETIAQLHTYQGLFHSFTPILSGTNLNLNCNGLRTLESFLTPAFTFTKARSNDETLVNEHHRTTNASNFFTNCNTIRQDDGTLCNPVLSDVDLEQSSRKLELYPNPSNGEVRLKWTALPSNSDSELQLFDVSGRQLLSWKLADIRTSGHIDLKLDDLAAGTYYLRVGDATKFLVIY